MSSHPILPAKYCTDCVLFDSKLVQIALVGLGIHPQNGQRDNFTHEQLSFDTNIFGLPVIVKSSLTSGFFQTFASTPGGYLTESRLGRCGPAAQTLTLFKTRISDFPTLFKTECQFLIPCLRHLLWHNQSGIKLGINTEVNGSQR